MPVIHGAPDERVIAPRRIGLDVEERLVLVDQPLGSAFSSFELAPQGSHLRRQHDLSDGSSAHRWGSGGHAHVEE